MKKNRPLTIPVESNMAKEITQQPEVWRKTYDSLLAQKNEICSFLDNACKNKSAQIILTGAGTSAFIGEILSPAFFKNTGINTKSVPTTDIVTHPGDFFHGSIPTLLVSFARSGDSPESVATFELAEKWHDAIFHLIITCNPDGKLAKVAANKKNCFVFLLPEETNDKALAMTSSFTCMTLAGLLISDIKNIETNEKNVTTLVKSGQVVLDKYSGSLREVATINFKRVVFLGSGPLKGTAKESHLKVIELTDGKIICQYDSYLGFRHGPKAIIDDATLLIYLHSNNPYVNNYEIDLIKSINQTEKFLFTIGVGQCLQKTENLTNLTISLDTDNTQLPDEYLSICSIMPAQLLGFYKSLELGLNPDSPSTNGGIHRVVQGVTIYPITY